MYFSRTRQYRLLLFLVIFELLSPALKAQDEPLSVFNYCMDKQSPWLKYSNNSNALYDHIASLADICLEERREKVSAFNTFNEWEEHLNDLQKTIFSGVDGFRRSPLNVRITGKIEREKYSVEKVVLETAPGFFLTGCLFIPKEGQKPFPAVLYAIGHSQIAFRVDVYQQSILNLVSKGFVVFTYDPIGQGERVQYLDPESNKSKIGDATLEHSYAGAQCLLTGYSISDYFIWDGVRAIDYLLTRSEVDPSRIGMTGRSGGGTLTADLSAYDKRVIASAPECYITSYQRLFESIGTQDAEQNFYKALSHGFEHTDLICMRAPLPTMIIATTHDFFSIQGTRETYKEAKEVFDLIGQAGKLTMVEAYGEHASIKENREEMYSFFRQYLKLPGDCGDEEVKYFSEEELKVSPTGQISSAYQSKTVFDLNKEKAVRVISDRVLKTPGDLFENQDFIIKKALELSGFDPFRRIRSVVYTGEIVEEKYKVEQYFLEGENFAYPIPFVLIKALTDEKRPLLLYLSPEGKEDLLTSGEIESYIDKGYSILAPDLIGTGELKNTSFKGDSYIQGKSLNLMIAANLVGQSIAGMQASDLDVLLKHIKTRSDVDSQNITSLVKGETCSSYLHFAIQNENISKTILVNPLVSFEDIIDTRYYNLRYMLTAVPGAVQYYDLPYLESLLATSNLVIVDPVTSQGIIADSLSSAEQQWFVKEFYELRGDKNQFEFDMTQDGVTWPRVLRYL